MDEVRDRLQIVFVTQIILAAKIPSLKEWRC